MFRIQPDSRGEIGQRLVVVAVLAVDAAAAADELDILGGEADGFRIVGDGLVEIMALAVNFAAAAVGGGALWVEADRLGVVVNRPLKVSLFMVGGAAVVIDHGTRRVVLDRFRAVGNRPIEVPLLVISVAALLVGERELPIEADCFGTVGDGQVELAPGVVLPAPIVVCPGIFRVQANGFRVVGDGQVEMAGFFPTKATGAVRHGRIRVELYRMVRVSECLLKIAALIIGPSPAAVRPVAAWVDPDGFVIGGNRGGELAGTDVVVSLFHGLRRRVRRRPAAQRRRQATEHGQPSENRRLHGRCFRSHHLPVGTPGGNRITRIAIGGARFARPTLQLGPSAGEVPHERESTRGGPARQAPPGAYTPPAMPREPIC